MLIHPSVLEASERLARIQKTLKSGRTLSRTDTVFLNGNYATPYGENALSLGVTKSASPELADDGLAYIPFTVTVLQVDRDGDLVVPRGRYGKNYEGNPIWFFGHQQWEVPIGTTRSPKDGHIDIVVTEKIIRQGCYFDKGDPDAMFIYGKVKRGYLNATSIAFVPLIARRRDEGHDEFGKANTHKGSHAPPGWFFEEWDHTETSIVGVPSNAGALRDSYDREKSFISPNCQKALWSYCAKSQGCWNGWCPCPDTSSQNATMKTHKCGCNDCKKHKPCPCDKNKGEKTKGSHLAGPTRDAGKKAAFNDLSNGTTTPNPQHDPELSKIWQQAYDKERQKLESSGLWPGMSVSWTIGRRTYYGTVIPPGSQLGYTKVKIDRIDGEGGMQKPGQTTSVQTSALTKKSLQSKAAQPSSHLDISDAKACKILEDGGYHTADGKWQDLTEEQRGMFGAKCGKHKKSLNKSYQGSSKEALAAAYQAGKAAKGKPNAQQLFNDWMRSNVTNASNFDVRNLQQEFGRGYQGKSLHQKYIRHEGDKWVVHAESGKVLGRHDTEEGAKRQLRAVEANKHKSKKSLLPHNTLKGANQADLETNNANVLPSAAAVMQENVDQNGEVMAASQPGMADNAATKKKETRKGPMNRVPNRYDPVLNPIQVGDKVIARQQILASDGSTLAKPGESLTVTGKDGPLWILERQGKTGKVGTPNLRKGARKMTRKEALNQANGQQGGYVVNGGFVTEATNGPPVTPGFVACPQCGGMGEIDNLTCEACGGTGFTQTNPLPPTGKNMKRYLVKMKTGGLYLAADGESFTKHLSKAKEFEDEEEAQEKAEEYDGETEEKEDSTGEADMDMGSNEPVSPVAKHSAQVIAGLGSHAKSESEYLDQEMAKMDNPMVAKALQRYKEKFVDPRHEHLKAMFEEHHPDHDYEETMKGMETDTGDMNGPEANPGEYGEVTEGEIPPAEPFAGEETPEEEAMEHGQLGEGLEQGGEGPGGEEDTEEILERYETPKGWASRVIGRVKRTKSGRLFVVAKGEGAFIEGHGGLEEEEGDRGAAPFNKNLPTGENIEDGVNEPAPFNKALDEEDGEAIKDASEYMKEMAEDEEVPKHHRSVVKFYGKRLGTVHKALTDMGHIQYNGGKGSPLTDEGHEQRNGGGGSPLSDKGEVQTSEGIPGREIISGSGKPDFGTEGGHGGNGLRNKSKGRPVSKEVEKSFNDFKKFFFQRTGINLGARNGSK